MPLPSCLCRSGITDPIGHLAPPRADLMAHPHGNISPWLYPTKVATHGSTGQSRVSDLAHGKENEFSLDRLVTLPSPPPPPQPAPTPS